MSKIFDKIFEIIAWLQIVASPTLLGGLIGAGIYFSKPNQTRLFIAIGIILFGIIVGILYANKIWKTKGTMWFISQVSATPDIDKLNEVKSGKKGNR